MIWAAQTGVTESYGDSTFRPGTCITRQEFAHLLYNYAAYKGDEKISLGCLQSLGTCLKKGQQHLDAWGEFFLLIPGDAHGKGGGFLQGHGPQALGLEQPEVGLGEEADPLPCPHLGQQRLHPAGARHTRRLPGLGKKRQAQLVQVGVCGAA